MTIQPGEIGQGSEQGISQGNQPATDSTANQPIVDQQGNINPAWNELLGVVPSQLHSQVTPHLQKWDQNFQSKIQEVHSQYEPWKPFIDNGVAPDDVEYALGLLNAVSQNPGEVIKALQEMVGPDQTEQQGQNGSTPQVPQNPEDEAIFQHPKFQEMQNALEQMAGILAQQKQQEQQATADQELETDMKKLAEQYGEFDEKYVLGVAMAGDEFNYQSLENAVKQFHEFKTGLLQQQRQPGPPVIGGGGAVPPATPQTTGLKDADRRALVANILAQAAQQQ